LSSNLIINATNQGSRIALLKDKDLAEFHYEEESNKFKVGDFYLGIVRKIVPGLNAAFIDIGYEKDAFLHYLDLGPQVRSLNKFTTQVLTRKINSPKLSGFKLQPDIEKTGKISQVLTKNQQVLVQIVKEPISTKGPRLSCEISIAGRYIVLVPFSKAVNISKKITDNKERQRLTRLINSIKPDNFGVIIRTVAEGKEVAELHADLNNLYETWVQGVKNLATAKPKTKVIGEISKVSSILRDLLNESFDAIHVDTKEAFEEINLLLKRIAPEKSKILKYYNGKAKIFEHFGIEKQLKTLFGKSVSLPGGGYLIIEHTEALHVIDVNSGNKSNSEKNQENTAITVNMEAAREIAKQLRLRDMGGIIVIDFIDMRDAENKRKLLNAVKNEMKDDRSKFTVLPLSKFGLMQITRQRVRPELNIAVQEKCPTCGGSGTISATIQVSDDIEKNLDFILTKQNEKKLTLALHPYLYSYFKQGFMSKRLKWFLKYFKWVNLVQDSSLGITDFRFFNTFGEEIEIL
jgi:ribonuclease G